MIEYIILKGIILKYSRRINMFVDIFMGLVIVDICIEIYGVVGMLL